MISSGAVRLRSCKLFGRKSDSRRKFCNFGPVLRVCSLARHSSLETASVGLGENQNSLKRLESLFLPDSLISFRISAGMRNQILRS